MATLGVAAVSRVQGLAFEPADASQASGADYGSGHFGRWIEDEFGLPAYR